MSLWLLTQLLLLAANAQTSTRSSSSSTAYNRIQTKQWMGDIYFPDFASTIRLQDVLLPGSHDAGAYQILDTPATGADNSVASCGPVNLGDVPDWVLDQLINLEVRGNVNLVETQKVTIAEQLLLGIRYLDLRLGLHDTTVRLHHTLFMDVTFQQVLAEIGAFLMAHPTELVIAKVRLQCGDLGAYRNDAARTIGDSILWRTVTGQYHGVSFGSIERQTLCAI